MGCGKSSTASAKYEENPSYNVSVGSGEKQADSKDGKMAAKQSARKENNLLIKYMQLLNRMPLFRPLPPDVHPILAANSSSMNFKAGTVIVKQGDVGEDLYILSSGTVHIKGFENDPPIEYFGEGQVLHGGQYPDTVEAQTDVVCWKISRSQLRELGLYDQLVKKRQAVRSKPDSVTDGQDLGPSPRRMDISAADKEFIAQKLASNDVLRMMTEDIDRRAKELAECVLCQNFSKGDRVITQGDEVAKFFYIINRGKFDVFVSTTTKLTRSIHKSMTRDGRLVDLDTQAFGKEDTQPKSEGRHVIIDDMDVGERMVTLERGACFGELALLYSQPRAATIVAASEGCSVWAVERINFKRVLMAAAGDRTQDYLKMIQTVHVFKNLSAEQQLTAAEAFTEMIFTRDELIIRQGDRGETFYVLYEGSVHITKDGNFVSTLDATSEPQYFGERALLKNEPRAASVQVASEQAKALVLDKAVFDLIRTNDAKDAILQKVHADEDRPTGIKYEDVTILGILGLGGFGKVELVQHKQTTKVYAVKTLSKGYVHSNKCVDNVINERFIMLSCNSPFIIKLYGTSQSKEWLYFFMEPALGGELYVVYDRCKFHGLKKHAMYYSAGVICAFEHLHQRYVIYRDLKPENLLLTGRGHVKLTDMGLAKFCITKTYTTCGTPDYFAPELIQSTGQTRAVDWWTLGIFIFELLTGHVPFKGDSELETYRKVLNGISKVSFPTSVDPAAKSLIEKLLVLEGSARLPMRQKGVEMLKKHKWYDGFDWESFQSLKMPVPYDPDVKSEKSLKQFRHVRNEDAKWRTFKEDGPNPFADF